MAFFKPASRKKVRGRIAFDGPAGSGKTFTALRLAHALGRKIAVINTESGAVEKYLGLNPDGIPWQFDVCELTDCSPTAYTQMILEAARCGYEVLIIDSFSHSWAGTGGALEQVDKKGADSKGNKFTAWKDVSPMMSRMVDAILQSPCHVIATMRTKMEYVLEEYTRDNGSKGTRPMKVGMAPVQRQGVEYEFDVVCDLDNTHTLTVSKTRCPDLDGQVIVKPNALFFEPLVRWLNEGTEVDPSQYIATEEDLRKSELARKQREADAKKAERQQEAAAKAAEKESAPKVDAKELIRQKAAERKAKKAGGSPLNGNQPADQPTPGDNGEDERAASDAGNESADHAPSDQPPFDAGGKDAGDGSQDDGSGGTVEDSHTGPSDGPCTSIQVEQLRTMTREIAKFDPKIEEKLKKALAAQGKSKFADLTREEANGLLNKLYQKAAGERLTRPSVDAAMTAVEADGKN